MNSQAARPYKGAHKSRELAIVLLNVHMQYRDGRNRSHDINQVRILSPSRLVSLHTKESSVDPSSSLHSLAVALGP